MGGELKELLERIPISLVAIAFALWTGWGAYNFQTAPDSPLKLKEQALRDAREEINKLKAKLKQIEDFKQTLEFKKAELRTLRAQLDETKADLGSDLDSSDLIKMLLTEAKRSGLEVTSITPIQSRNQQQPNPAEPSYTTDQDYELKSSGIYFQYVAFLDRVANLKKIIRVEDMAFSSAVPSTSKYVLLKSTFLMRTYVYNQTKADAMGASPADLPTNGGPGASPGTGSRPQGTGTTPAGRPAQGAGA